jgi:non-specific serine/threonine protein kinase
LETAEQICNSNSDLPNVMEHLLSLVSKSLIKRQDGASEPRFVMLESIREYAREKLLEHNETSQLHQALIRNYLALVENFEPLLVPDIGTYYAPLDGELDNLRSVLAWSLGDENRGQATELGVRLAGSLSFFWYVRGMLSDGRYWLNLAARYALEPDVHRARIMHGLGVLAWQQGDYSVAISAFEEGISLWRQVDYPVGLAEGLHLLGHAQFDHREYEIAAKLFRESYTLYVEMDEIIATLPLISDLGLVAYHQHNYASAQELFKQSLALCREHGNKGGAMDAANRLGDLMRLAGNYEAATQLYEESLAVGQEVRANLGIASAKHKLGCMAKHAGDKKQAKSYFLESLDIQEAAGNKQGSLECLAGLAGLINEPSPAAKLFAAIDTLLDTVGVPLAPADQQDYERDRNRVCSQPDVNCLAEPSAEMTLQEAVAYARIYTQPQSP